MSSVANGWYWQSESEVPKAMGHLSPEFQKLAVLPERRRAKKEFKASNSTPFADADAPKSSLDFVFSDKFLDDQSKVQHQAAMDDFRVEMNQYCEDLRDKLSLLEGKGSVKQPPRLTAQQRREEDTKHTEDRVEQQRRCIDERHQKLSETRQNLRRKQADEELSM